ncbi:hypothetical protein [Nocardia salmonicida]|uniref:hypothetical protein n=1 Tax=Nocardia salmonicida TaxID=53431 RepID=UPI0033CDBCEE
MVAVAAIVGHSSMVGPAGAQSDSGLSAQSVFGITGQHQVATSTVTDPCQESVVGMIAHITAHLFGNRDDLECTQAFPYGLQSPVGGNTYFPADIGDLDSAPLILFEGGNFAWVRWWEYNLMFNAPAWIANALGVGHFSPVDGTDAYLSSGTAVAWLKYLAFDDDTAEQFFVGPQWGLKDDPTFFSVERNALASGLR